jgi:hypothetical protein
MQSEEDLCSDPLPFNIFFFFLESCACYSNTYLQLLSHNIVITFHIRNYILAAETSNILHEVAPQC